MDQQLNLNSVHKLVIYEESLKSMNINVESSRLFFESS